MEDGLQLFKDNFTWELMTWTGQSRAPAPWPGSPGWDNIRDKDIGERKYWITFLSSFRLRSKIIVKQKGQKDDLMISCYKPP